MILVFDFVVVAVILSGDVTTWGYFEIVCLNIFLNGVMVLIVLVGIFDFEVNVFYCIYFL